MRELEDFEQDIMMLIADFDIEREKLEARLDRATEALASLRQKEQTLRKALEIRRSFRNGVRGEG